MNLRTVVTLIMVFFVSACSGTGTRNEILSQPLLVAIDSVVDLAFVVDQSENTFSVVDLSDDSVVDDEAILDSDDATILPTLPYAVAVQNRGASQSRIFISGNNSQVTVLDFDGTTLSAASFSPLAVGSGTTDIIAGLALDPTRNKLYVANSSDGFIYVFSTEDGTVDTNSPINIGGSPYGLSYDSEIDYLAIAQSSATTVSFLNGADLTEVPSTLELSKKTKSVSLLSNDIGSVLFFSSATSNAAGAFRVNLSDFSTSTQIGSLVEAVGPNDTLPDPNVLTGLVSSLKGGELDSGILKVFVTQSSGDLLIFELSADLTQLSYGITTIGAISGEGIDVLLDSDGFLEKVYFASPGIGSLTIVDAISDLFLDQII